MYRSQAAAEAFSGPRLRALKPLGLLREPARGHWQTVAPWQAWEGFSRRWAEEGRVPINRPESGISPECSVQAS